MNRMQKQSFPFFHNENILSLLFSKGSFMKVKLAGPITKAVGKGIDHIVISSSNKSVGGRLVRAIPVGVAASLMFLLLPVTLLVDRVAKPILKSTNGLRQENGALYTRKHKVASWALMLPKLVATVPVAAVAAVVMVAATSLFLVGFPIGIAMGKYKNGIFTRHRS